MRFSEITFCVFGVIIAGGIGFCTNPRRDRYTRRIGAAALLVLLALVVFPVSDRPHNIAWYFFSALASASAFVILVLVMADGKMWQRVVAGTIGLVAIAAALACAFCLWRA